jgi:hypothetical protein
VDQDEWSAFGFAFVADAYLAVADEEATQGYR